MNVTQDIVMNYTHVIDPIERKRQRLRRQKNLDPGPNFLWHLDGCDRLAPFGLYIHRAMDGYSRRIIWLEVGSTNKNSRFIAWHYLSTVQQLGDVLRLVRSN